MLMNIEISASRRAVYAGSFDPPTNGHLWMIRAAQSMFDEVVVSIGVNPDKHSTYTVDERKAMLAAITQEVPNVVVDTFENEFFFFFLHKNCADFIIRGIRTASDYEYERSIRYINADLQPLISTVFLMPPREFAEVSSTMVKGMVGPKGWRQMIRRYVPEEVYEKILRDAEHTDDDSH